MSSHPNVEHAKSKLSIDSLNDLLALWITKGVGTMWCAYVFAALSAVSLPAAIASHNPVVLVSWISQTFLQLVLLSVIIVGQNLIQDKQNAKADVDHQTLTYLAKLQDEQLEILRIIDPRRSDHG